MSKYNASMFESIKDALKKQEAGQKRTDIMRMDTGNTYIVKLIPNIEEAAKTFHHYYSYGWESFANGQFVSNVSPTSFGEADPIAEERSRVYKHGTDAEKDKMKSVRRAEKWLVNVYVVKDPANEDNNGTVKVLRFGKQLYKIIMDAIEGEEAEEFGDSVFDLSSDTVLKIKCEAQGDYPTFVASKFAAVKKSGLSDDQIDKVFESINDLATVLPVKSYDELKSVLEEHYFCDSSEPTVEPKWVKNETGDTPVETDENDDNGLLDDPEIQKLLAASETD